MKFENAVYPTSNQIDTLRREASSAPIVMLNLLRFRDRAEYADGRKTDLTGAQAYALYADKMRVIVEREGGKFLFAGDIRDVIIGEVEDVWDLAGLVEYPSAAAFAKIATSKEVAEVGVHRSAGLQGQLLLRVVQR